MANGDSILNKRDRINRREIEKYNMANVSHAKWSTVKKFQADSMFLSADDDKNWWEVPEPTTEKKMEMFRKAESDVKKDLAMKKTFKPYQRKYTRWSSGQASYGYSSYPVANSIRPHHNRSGYSNRVRPDVMAGQPNYTPSLLQRPPFQVGYAPVNNSLPSSSSSAGGPKKCYKCHEYGHIESQCKKG